MVLDGSWAVYEGDGPELSSYFISVLFIPLVAARSSQASETIKRLELEASQGRSKCLHLEGAIRVKEREVSCGRQWHCVLIFGGEERSRRSRLMHDLKLQLTVKCANSPPDSVPQADRLTRLLEGARVAEAEVYTPHPFCRLTA